MSPGRTRTAPNCNHWAKGRGEILSLQSSRWKRELLTFHEPPTKRLSLFHTTTAYYNASRNKKSYLTCCLYHIAFYECTERSGKFLFRRGSGRRGGAKEKEILFFSSSFFRQRLNVPSGWDKDAWPNEQKEKKIPGENIKDGQEKNTVRLRDATSATNSRTKLSSNTYLFSLPTWWQRRLSD